jgi:hypothetical protein
MSQRADEGIVDFGFGFGWLIFQDRRELWRNSSLDTPRLLWRWHIQPVYMVI